MIYKTLKKVSDVCQLLDKSKYPATQTNAGVTITNNGDGTITANGNCTYNTYFNITEINEFTIKAKHKYLILDSSGSTSRNQYSTWVRAGRGFILLDSVSTPIGSIGYNDNKCTVFIRFNNGVSVSNITFKPQLFDLTEMYGAGNEPTTVEQFRQDFPEEMYDYKPYCFVKSYKTLLKASDNNIITSYKKSLICTTKNLLDINQSINNSGENAFDTFSINDNVITATSDNSTTKIVIMRLFYGELSAGDYILSLNAVIENTPKHNRPNEIFIFKNGSFLTLNNSMPTDGSYSPKIKFTLSEKATIEISFYKSVNTSQETVSDTVYKVTLSNIQLELGDTATEYHPYGYL